MSTENKGKRGIINDQCKKRYRKTPKGTTYKNEDKQQINQTNDKEQHTAIRNGGTNSSKQQPTTKTQIRIANRQAIKQTSTHANK